MQKFSKSALKKAIISAETSRLKNDPNFHADRMQQSILQKDQRESNKAISELLKNAGLDLREFQALQERRDNVCLEMVAGHKAEALEQAKAIGDRFSSNYTDQIKAWQTIAAIPETPVRRIVLNAPFLIWSYPFSAITDSATVPWGSWVKCRVKNTDGIGTQKVSFFYYWKNNASDYAVITVSNLMKATGHLKAHAPWTFGVNTSRIYASARLGLWFGIPSDINAPSFEKKDIGSSSALSFITTGGNTNGFTVNSVTSLAKNTFAVPPGEIVVIETALAIDYENEDGDIDADFESGDFSVISPFVVVRLLNDPPIS